MAKHNETELDTAPITPPAYVPTMPRQKYVERQGARSEPYAKRHPRVVGGKCEWCGVINPNFGNDQYKLCEHYRGMQLRCSYCDENKNPDEIVYHAQLNVSDNPYNPNELIVWCDSYSCSAAHEKRFQLNR